LDFDLWLDALPLADTQIVSLTFPGIAQVALLVRSTPPRASVEELTFTDAGLIAGFKRHALADVLTPGQLHRMQLRFDFVDRRVTATVDGSSVLADNLVLAFERGSFFSAQVGVVFANPSAAVEARLGNFVLDAK